MFSLDFRLRICCAYGMILELIFPKCGTILLRKTERQRAGPGLPARHRRFLKKSRSKAPARVSPMPL